MKVIFEGGVRYSTGISEIEVEKGSIDYIFSQISEKSGKEIKAIIDKNRKLSYVKVKDGKNEIKISALFFVDGKSIFEIDTNNIDGEMKVIMPVGGG